MPEASAGDGVPGAAETVRVLHVDDDEDFCALAAEQLERADGGLSVATETDPDRVLDRLASERFDAVVSDYEMPECDGLELLRTVRERHGELPFFLFTGSGSEAVASEAIAAGVADYLRRGEGPEQYAVLANRIRNAVQATRERARAEDLERINRLIRGLNRRIARLDSVPAIERTICETIAEAEPYRFAWLGHPHETSGELCIRATGGDADAYLEAVEIRTDDTPKGRGPAGRAARTREAQVEQNISGDPTFEPWREIAAEYEFRSVAVLPVQGSESEHGLLAVYADRRDAFDERELAVLEELAETIGGALEGARARRRLERRERELERYESIVEASGDPVYVLDSRGQFQFVNDRFVEMAGHDAQTLVGEHVDIVLPPDDVAAGEELIQSLLKSDRQRGTYDMTLVTADGEQIPCESHVSLLPFEESFRGTVGVVRDITRRKERERELERQNERLEEFASVVSHDLRNPLNVVEGSIELAAATEDFDELDRARRALDRMRTLIDDLLMLARERDAVSDFEPVALDAVATEAWSVVDTRDARLQVETDRTVCADESRLRQLLQNLFANSVEHGSADSRAQSGDADAVEHEAPTPRSESPDGDGTEATDSTGTTDGDGTEATDGNRGVTVTVGDFRTETSEQSGFYVADDGAGIPPDKREAVFERAYSTSEDGTGFGLRIVERIAEAHGWSVGVTDSATDGARFEFRGVEFAGE